MIGVVSLLANWLSDPDAPRFVHSPWPFIVLVLLGFAIGIFGHITKIKGFIIFGIALVFLITTVLPFILLGAQD
jgi:antibiotic biosynthesis monooxygenase (ABM) superfamily enzyme